MNKYDEALQTLTEKFGQDTFISLATTDGDRVFVRVVNAYYENGAFYAVISAASNKMKQIAKYPHVALSCGQLWALYLNAHGVGENLGHVLVEENMVMMGQLRKVFSSWYSHGDVNENDPNTCLLRIRLTDATYYAYKNESDGKDFKIDFVNRTVE
ncbi:MAG: pyridoxamine 5'-phosphate oxidase family protein [Oscillospiraceae bacterium]|nr:pyridoxamine 5'-phosphate oxidase family protein [Oscillospiraceae bacterium]